MTSFDTYQRSKVDALLADKLDADGTAASAAALTDAGVAAVFASTACSQRVAELDKYDLATVTPTVAEDDETSATFALADFTVNTCDGTAYTTANVFTFPDAVADGKARDFLIRYTCGVAPTFPDSVTIETDADGDAFADWEWTVGSTYIISFTETASGVFLAARKEVQ